MALGHYLEQCALHLGGSTVDLVGQHEVGEHRAQTRGEVAIAGEHLPTHHVTRHQVRRELDAVEVAPAHLGHGLECEGLGKAGHALKQHVATGEQGDEHAVEQLVLPHHHAAQLVEHGLKPVAWRCVGVRHGDGIVIHWRCSLIVHHFTDSSIRCTSAEVTAKPMPTLPGTGLLIDVGIPTRRPRRSKRPPPELPGLIGASVWIMG